MFYLIIFQCVAFFVDLGITFFMCYRYKLQKDKLPREKRLALMIFDFIRKHSLFDYYFYLIINELSVLIYLIVILTVSLLNRTRKFQKPVIFMISKNLGKLFRDFWSCNLANLTKITVTKSFCPQMVLYFEINKFRYLYRVEVSLTRHFHSRFKANVLLPSEICFKEPSWSCIQTVFCCLPHILPEFRPCKRFSHRSCTNRTCRVENNCLRNFLCRFFDTVPTTAQGVTYNRIHPA